ncbi:MAG TPA: LysR family transcriptional regulator [Polyangiaceae bacterium]|jgi:DNA-binding transcriptional LysR family regulator|nr:LysR family transcriptional regulator [Polyangiaceae bacterium]
MRSRSPKESSIESARRKKKPAKQAVATTVLAEPRRSHFEPPTMFAYVDAVAQHGSIRKAAEALHVASSAVNRRILDLEEEIGFPLFERLARGVRATGAGELFLVYVRRSLKELRQLEAQIDGLRGLAQGYVRVAVAESVTTRMLPDAIADYQSRHPGIAFSVTVDGPERLTRLLLDDTVDLIFTHAPVVERGVEVLASAAQPLCALVSAEHPLATRQSVRLHDCVAYPIAMPDETLAARGFLDAALRRAAITLEPALVSNSVETTKIFARTRQGVCFSFHIGNKADISGMVTIPLSDPLLGDTRLELATRRGRVLPVAAASFAEELVALFEKL